MFLDRTTVWKERKKGQELGRSSHLTTLATYFVSCYCWIVFPIKVKFYDIFKISHSLGHCFSKCDPGPAMPASPGNKKYISLGPPQTTESESPQVGPVVSMLTTPPADVKIMAPGYFQNSKVL